MLLALLRALVWRVALTSADQTPFETPQPTFQVEISGLENSTAPFIFNGLSSLLTQWPNTVHGTGRLILDTL
ncbi:hypothetical protein DFH09DRAFT_11351 [Mycena vulgaris]|nr:hypothetical protein DFH09DRAFT_11351 [Mycena vulgaris]